MRSAETQQRHAAVDVLEVVVGVRDAQLALVLAAVVVAVADQRGLVVVVEVRVADGQVVGAVAEVRQAVVEVLARVLVGAQVQVVEPDVGRGLHADGVAACVAGGDFADGEVLDDDVLCIADKQAKACEAGGGVDAEDGLVAADANLCAAGDLALDVDDGCGVVFDCGGEGSVCGDCD